jgi:hypothetical protein
MNRPNRIMLRRFFRKVRIERGGCWEWIGHRNHDGYGGFWLPDLQMKTTSHRVAFAWFVRTPKPREVVDHLCRNRSCVNPAHLEAVTQSVNLKRGAGAFLRPFCKKGHALTGDNIRTITNYRGEVFRRCQTCHALKAAEQLATRALARKKRFVQSMVGARFL